MLRFDRREMRAAASDPGLLATDVAEYLVVRGMPFRAAHQLVAAAVRRTVEEGRTLRDMSAAEWRELTELADDDIVELFDIDSALRRRELPGAPGAEDGLAPAGAGGDARRQDAAGGHRAGAPAGRRQGGGRGRRARGAERPRGGAPPGALGEVEGLTLSSMG